MEFIPRNRYDGYQKGTIVRWISGCYRSEGSQAGTTVTDLKLVPVRQISNRYQNDGSQTGTSVVDHILARSTGRLRQLGQRRLGGDGDALTPVDLPGEMRKYSIPPAEGQSLLIIIGSYYIRGQCQEILKLNSKIFSIQCE